MRKIWYVPGPGGARSPAAGGYPAAAAADDHGVSRIPSGRGVCGGGGGDSGAGEAASAADEAAASAANDPSTDSAADEGSAGEEASAGGDASATDAASAGEDASAGDEASAADEASVADEACMAAETSAADGNGMPMALGGNSAPGSGAAADGIGRIPAGRRACGRGGSSDGEEASAADCPSSSAADNAASSAADEASSAADKAFATDKPSAGDGASATNRASTADGSLFSWTSIAVGGNAAPGSCTMAVGEAGIDCNSVLVLATSLSSVTERLGVDSSAQAALLSPPRSLAESSEGVPSSNRRAISAFPAFIFRTFLETRGVRGVVSKSVFSFVIQKYTKDDCSSIFESKDSINEYPEL